MEIHQEKCNFKPVTITLSTASEANAFFSLVDKIEHYRCDVKEEISFTQSEVNILMALSNALTNSHIII
jgi:hypothetical protein